MSIRIYKYYPLMTPRHLVGHPQSELVGVAPLEMLDEVELEIARKNKELDDAGLPHRVGYSVSDIKVFVPGQAVRL